MISHSTPCVAAIDASSDHAQYHRTCHQVDSLWRVHSLHHGTKRASAVSALAHATPDPTVLLSIFADNVQELIEILLCPLFASLVVQCSWAELLIANS